MGLTFRRSEGILSLVQTATQRLLDHLLDGQLRSYVLERRNQGQSWRRISLALHDELQVDVSFETLRRWFSEAQPQDAA